VGGFASRVGARLFGGLLPVTGLWLCASTGNIYGGPYNPIAVAALTFVVGTLLLKETHGTLIWNEAGRDRHEDRAELGGVASTVAPCGRRRLLWARSCPGL